MKVINTFLWGNVPAYDHINLPCNEGSNLKKGTYDILFAASGDLRHVLESVESIELLLESVDIVNIHLNDINTMVAVRNLIILHILGTTQSVDMAINIWYSSALTSQQSLYIKGLVNPGALSKAKGFDEIVK